MVVAEPAHHDHEPGGELPTAIGNVGAEPRAIVLLQGGRHERIAVHYGVMVPADAAGDMEDETAVRFEKGGPGGGPGVRIGRGQ